MGKHEKTEEEIIVNCVVNDNNSKRKVKPKKKKKKHIFLIIFLILLVLLALFVAKRLHDARGNVIGAILGHNEETLKNLDKLQVLILGESTGMSDTIMVASYDPKTQEAALLSIPRDTFIGNDKKHTTVYDKINSLYSNGDTPEKTLAAVNKLTGLDLKYYIIVDTKALQKLVDTIGGVEFDVPIDMDYDDYSQDLFIHLKAGVQTLNGDQAEQLVRFRHNNDYSSYSYSYGDNDLGRMRTQRNFIIATIKQTIRMKNVAQIGNIIDIFKQYVKTNLDFNNVKDYIPYAIKINTDNIKAAQLPGTAQYLGYLSFFLCDEEETQELVKEFFLDKPEIIEENDENITVTTP